MIRWWKCKKKRPVILCEGEKLKNVWSFKYMGTKFSADGDNMTDIRERISMTHKTAGKLATQHMGIKVDPTAPETVYLCHRCLHATDIRLRGLEPR